MPENDVREALGRLELFEGAPPSILERLVIAARPFSLAAGEYLFREGDPGDHISVLARAAWRQACGSRAGERSRSSPCAPVA